MFSANKVPMFFIVLSENQATCGDAMKLYSSPSDFAKSGLSSLDHGSFVKTSVAAPDIFRSLRATKRASSLTTPPLATLMTRALGCIWSNSVVEMRSRVSGIKGHIRTRTVDFFTRVVNGTRVGD